LITRLTLLVCVATMAIGVNITTSNGHYADQRKDRTSEDIRHLHGISFQSFIKVGKQVTSSVIVIL
jgi:hypothetical protein